MEQSILPLSYSFYGVYPKRTGTLAMANQAASENEIARTEASSSFNMPEVPSEVGQYLFAEMLRIREMGCELELAMRHGEIAEEIYYEIADMCHCQSCVAGFVLFAAWNRLPELGRLTGHDQLRLETDPHYFAESLHHAMGRVQNRKTPS
jgi:hypothetical protein